MTNTSGRNILNTSTRKVKKTIELKKHLGLKTMISNTLTMAWRALLKLKHTPEQLVDVLIQPILFTLLFAFIFGGAIAGDMATYLPILIPGILVQSIIMGAVTTGVQMREDMDKGVSNRFKVLPIARVSHLAGALITDIIRYGIIAIITFIMGFIIGWRPEGGVLGLVGGGLLTIFCAWCMSWIFALIGLFVKHAGSVQGFSMCVLFPLTFLSNAFIPVNTLPSYLQGFANVNPVSHIVTAVRELASTGTISADFWWAILGGLIIVAIFAPVTVWAYKRKG
jgi:ABC-2 type transport system permease protein